MEEILRAFLGMKTYTYEAFGSGHINSTFKVTTESGMQYVLQKINHHVFKNPEQVVANAVAVTNHLRAKGDVALHLLQDCNGRYCHIDAEGNHWRLYEYVPGIALDAPESPKDLYAAGLGFGHFQQDLLDFPADTLYETIPHFHDTLDRYAQLEAAIAADRVGRLAQVQELLPWVMEQKALAGTLLEQQAAGKLPLRVTHNDTKLNNVLFDCDTREPLCILDLDTVMPGLSAYDFGDAIRYGAATDREDATENHMDIGLFTQYAKGYLKAVTNLTPQEVDALPMGAFLMTLEVGVRFLTDYLDGDRYFRIAYPQHNLDRAKNQLALAKDIKQKLPLMEEVLHSL